MIRRRQIEPASPICFAHPLRGRAAAAEEAGNNTGVFTVDVAIAVASAAGVAGDPVVQAPVD